MIVRWLHETSVNIIKATCLFLSAERSIIYYNYIRVYNVSHIVIKPEYNVFFFRLSSRTLFDRQAIFNGLFGAHVHFIYMKITAIRYLIHNPYIVYVYGLDNGQLAGYRHIIFMYAVSTRIFHKNTNLDVMFLGPNRDLSFLS